MIKSENGQVVLEGDFNALLTDLLFAINGVKTAAIENFDMPEDEAKHALYMLFSMAMNDPELEPESECTMTVDATGLEELLRRMKDNEEN